MSLIKNVFTWLTIISEGFKNFVEFYFAIRFTPRKCFVNALASFPEHYSYFYQVRLDFVPAKNQVNCSLNSCQLHAAFPVKKTELGSLQRLIVIIANAPYKLFYSQNIKNHKICFKKDGCFLNTSYTMW